MNIKLILLNLFFFASLLNATFLETAQNTPNYNEKTVQVNFKNLALEDYLLLVSAMTKKDVYLEEPLPQVNMKIKSFDEDMSINDLIKVAKQELQKEGLLFIEEKNRFLVGSFNVSKINKPFLLVRNIEKDKIKAYRIDGRMVGIEIASLQRGGPFQEAGFKKHDIILSINETQIVNIAMKDSKVFFKELLNYVGTLNFGVLRAKKKIILKMRMKN